ncbi:MAG: hypothetical protein K0S93_335 [Nitrososphaeraceae archaeon]|jgi:hypothetical protein|nr:hypothetical protein [Nitrososphaeraceae archaeon]
MILKIVTKLINTYLPFNNNFYKIKVYGNIVKLNGLTTWLFNDVVVR